MTIPKSTSELQAKIAALGALRADFLSLLVEGTDMLRACRKAGIKPKDPACALAGVEQLREIADMGLATMPGNLIIAAALDELDASDAWLRDLTRQRTRS